MVVVPPRTNSNAAPSVHVFSAAITPDLHHNIRCDSEHWLMQDPLLQDQRRDVISDEVGRQTAWVWTC